MGALYSVNTTIERHSKSGAQFSLVTQHRRSERVEGLGKGQHPGADGPRVAGVKPAPVAGLKLVRVPTHDLGADAAPGGLGSGVHIWKREW